MKSLVMGSCRIAQPLQDRDDMVLYPGGHVHSPAEMIQALKIMEGRICIPPELEKYAFRGWGLRDNKRVDLNTIDRLILEVSSVKRYVYTGYDSFVLHIGYEDNIKRNEILPLESVVLLRETYSEILNNLNVIYNMINRKKIVVFCQNNISQLPVRYMLSYALSTWCRGNNQIFFDPTRIVAEYGMERCFLPKDGDFDTQHYTEFMQNKIVEYIDSFDPLPEYCMCEAGVIQEAQF